MSNKTEDYLDSLLSNISPEHKRQVQEKKSSDYMADFEKELEHMDMEEFVQDFEREIDREEGAEEGPSEQEFFDNLEGIVEGAQKTEEQNTEETGQDPEDGFEVNTMEDDGWTQPEGGDNPETEAPEEKEAAGGDSEQTEEEKDLMELLSEVAQTDEELSGIGDLLSAEENHQQIDDGGDTEISLSEIVEDEEEPSGKGKKKRRKKEKREGESFFQKISRILFGEDDEEKIEGGKRGVAEAGAMSGSQGSAPEGQELGNISDENLQILQELDSAGQGGEEETEKGKKKKKKKEKKPKQKKQKKPKEKKPKKPKEKKPKKPKEVDLSPPLPKGPVILIFVMGASLILFVMLSANLLNHSADVKEATALFNKSDYVKAYRLLEGMKLKEDEEALYQKALVLAQVQSEYQAGETLYTAKQYQKSLDSYICALGRYDTNCEHALELGAEEEMTALEKLIVFQLEEGFGVSPETAREIYRERSRKEYTRRIYEIIKSKGLLTVEE